MISVTQQPRTPDVAHLADDFLLMGPFVRYEMVPGTNIARILSSGTQPLGGTRIERSRGASILVLEGAHDTDYIDFTGVAPLVRPRPIMTWDFDRTKVLPKQEAILKAVPSCDVSYSGPMKGSVAHVNGDLAIGFTMPGTYEISFEAFPYMPAKRTLVVEPVASVTATVSTATVGVKT